MMTTFRLRLRFDLATRLSSEEPEIEFDFRGRTAKIKPHIRGAAFKDCSAVVISATGFDSADEAAQYGATLAAAVRLLDVDKRLGIDLGEDQATSSFSAQIATALKNEHGADLRPDVHGLDVFEDRPKFVFLSASGTATGLTSPQNVLDGLQTVEFAASAVSPETLAAVRQLNEAISTPSDLAKMALAVSAIESLGHSAKWSRAQEEAIRRLRATAAADAELKEEERTEVANAIKRSLFPISLRQGVLKLLAELGLQELKKPWDDAYGQRSGVIHG